MDKKVFIGIDVGRVKNSINIIDSNGKSISKKSLEIANDYYGFLKLKEEIDILSFDFKFSYDEVIVGVESTGHYWFNLKDYLDSVGILTVMIKTDAVKHRRALEEGQKGKNDTLDARVIASCLRNGNYNFIREHERERRALQKLTRLRDDCSVNVATLKNKITRCIDICNPVYFKIFETLNVRTGIGILKYYPFPHSILNESLKEIAEKVKLYTSRPDVKLIKLYKEECEVFCEYIKESTYVEKIELLNYLNKYLNEKEYKEKLDEDIKEIARNIIPLYNEFEKIKGIPIIQLISIISEIGDIRNFKNTRTILAYLGLSIRGNSSGKYIGEKRINKAGSRIVRKHLFNITDCLLRHNEYFRVAYCYYKSYDHKQPKVKREMQIALLCKVVRVIYGMLKYNSLFSYEEMFKGYDFNMCNMDKFKEEFEGESKRKPIKDYTFAYNIYLAYKS